MVSTENTSAKTQTNMTMLRLITPTHWIQIAENTAGSKPVFVNAAFGVYTLKDKTAYPSIHIASYPLSAGIKSEIIYNVNGDKLVYSAIVTYANGRISKWKDVFQRVPQQMAKNVSTSK
jgi:hypothetical protein